MTSRGTFDLTAPGSTTQLARFIFSLSDSFGLFNERLSSCSPQPFDWRSDTDNTSLAKAIEEWRWSLCATNDEPWLSRYAVSLPYGPCSQRLTGSFFVFKNPRRPTLTTALNQIDCFSCSPYTFLARSAPRNSRKGHICARHSGRLFFWSAEDISTDLAHSDTSSQTAYVLMYAMQMKLDLSVS